MSTTIKTISEWKAALSFGTILDTSSQEPVIIKRRARPDCIILNVEDLEDAWLGEQLEKSECQNLIWVEASENLLNQMRNAQN